MPIDTRTGEAIYSRLIEIASDLGELKGTTDQVLKQTTETNGRVNKLEEEMLQVRLIKYWLYGAWAGLLFMGALLYKVLELYKLLMGK